MRSVFSFVAPHTECITGNSETGNFLVWVRVADHPPTSNNVTCRTKCTRDSDVGAVEHRKIRHAQGYTIPMIIEESRMLQVSLFHTLQSNLNVVDFSLLLIDVMTIADEVDSQLKQTIMSFTEASVANASFIPAEEPA